MSDSPGPSDDGPGTPTANGDADLGGQAMSANGHSAEGSTLFTSCLGVSCGIGRPVEALQSCRARERGRSTQPAWYRVE